MKYVALGILLLVALAVALALPPPGGAAFWSPISPIPGCEGKENQEYALCCMYYADDWPTQCPPEAFLSDPDHGATQPPPAATPTRARHSRRAEPVHGEYTPPVCWAVSPGRQLCVWEGIWSAPEVDGVQAR